MILVFGHFCPDSDSVCSALVTAEWLNTTGKPAQAYRLGEINKETQFILSEANILPPPLLTGSIEQQEVWLVDFTDLEQGPLNLDKSHIIGIFDHHKLGNLTTSMPLDLWVRAVGSTATVIWTTLEKNFNWLPNAPYAKLLIGAILSDTVGLTSSTTTELDKQAVDSLNHIAQLDISYFTRSLLSAKTDLTGLSLTELLRKDRKYFEIASKKICISQLEIASFSQVEDKLPELIATMTSETNHNNDDLSVLIVTNINECSSMLYFSPNPYIPQKEHFMPGAMSRKKDILPWLFQQLT